VAIKGVLREELNNSFQMQKRYQAELLKLPKGSLVKKKIKGNFYYYLIVRSAGKVKFFYKGKMISPKILGQYAQIKKTRAKYRKLLSQVKKQIKFLKGALRGKEAI